MASVAAIVVSFETRDHLGPCLASLTATGAEVVVVDNASSDGSAALVRERFPELRVLALEQNVGFGAACNAGATATETEYLLFLNPDTVVRHGAIQALLRCIELAGNVACVAPTLLTPDGHRQLSVLRYPGIFASGRPAVSSFPTVVSGSVGSSTDLVDEYPVGAALLVRRQAFAQAGGFDPGFFHFYEEVDLCKRLLDGGWSIRTCPAAEVEHSGGASTTPRWARTYPHQLRGHIRYVGKHRGRLAAQLARVLLLGALAVRIVVSRGDLRRAYRNGFRWLLTADVAKVAAPAATATADWAKA